MRYLTSPQCRAARALLNWSQPDLAKQSGVHVQTICAFENETGTPTKTTLEKITTAFEVSGIEFTTDGGLRPTASRFLHLTGESGFKELMDDTYQVAKSQGGEFILYNAKPDNWIKWVGQDWYNSHIERMEKTRDKLSYRITCEENETNFISRKFAEYRWVPKRFFNQQSIYCYADRIAFVNFTEDSVNIFVLYNQDFCHSFSLLFDLVWDEIATIPTVSGYKPSE